MVTFHSYLERENDKVSKFHSPGANLRKCGTIRFYAWIMKVDLEKTWL